MGSSGGTTDASAPAGVALYATAASRLRAPKLRALRAFHVQCPSLTPACVVWSSLRRVAAGEGAKAHDLQPEKVFGACPSGRRRWGARSAVRPVAMCCFGYPRTSECCCTREDQAHRHNGSAHRRDDSSNDTRAGSSGGTADVSTPAGVAANATAASRLRATGFQALRSFHVQCSYLTPAGVV